MQAHPDCCSSPQVEIVRNIFEHAHESRDLCQCRSCRAYWQMDWEERMSFDGDNDPSWTWYSRLTDEEVERILDAQSIA